MIIKNEQDFYSGLMFMAFGGFFAVYSYIKYDMGDLMRLGPGFFPLALGILLFVIGAIVGLQGLRGEANPETRIGKFDWDILILIIGSVLFFAFALKALGLMLTIVCVCLLSSLASHDFSLRAAIAIAIFMAIFSWLVFIEGLGMVLQMWPSHPSEWSFVAIAFIVCALILAAFLLFRRTRNESVKL